MSSSIPLVEVPRARPRFFELVLDPHLVVLALKNPGHALREIFAIVHGAVFTQWVRLFCPRVRIGRSLRIYGRLVIRGPGTVTIGNDVIINGRTTPFTHRAGASIEVGDRSTLDGTRISCVSAVKIGTDCLIANGRILDTAFHSARRVAGTPAGPILEAPVEIGNNVWVSLDAALLPGTRIGENSVVALGAVCKGEYPANVMIMGNPARVAGPIF